MSSDEKLESYTTDFSLPTAEQRRIGEVWLKRYGHLLADDPAFVAAAVYRVMMMARLEPNAPELQGLR